MNLDERTKRIVDSLCLAAPFLVVLLVSPWKDAFLINFLILVFPVFLALALLVFLEAQQPLLAGLASAVAIYPLACIAVASITKSWAWVDEYALLPALPVGLWLVIRMSRRRPTRAALVVLAVVLPLACVAAEAVLLFAFSRFWRA